MQLTPQLEALEGTGEFTEEKGGKLERERACIGLGGNSTSASNDPRG